MDLNISHFAELIANSQYLILSYRRGLETIKLNPNDETILKEERTKISTLTSEFELKYQKMASTILYYKYDPNPNIIQSFIDDIAIIRMDLCEVMDMIIYTEMYKTFNKDVFTFYGAIFDLELDLKNLKTPIDKGKGHSKPEQIMEGSKQTITFQNSPFQFQHEFEIFIKLHESFNLSNKVRWTYIYLVLTEHCKIKLSQEKFFAFISKNFQQVAKRIQESANDEKLIQQLKLIVASVQ